MSPERYNNTTDKIAAEINAAGEFVTNKVFGHGDTYEIIFVNMCRGSLSISEITEDFTLSTKGVFFLLIKSVVACGHHLVGTLTASIDTRYAA